MRGRGRRPWRPSIHSLRTNGGGTLHDIGRACPLNESDVAGMLDDMNEEGQVTAHYQGHCILYRYTGPMLRALCR
jgi:hypothetical protein